MNKRLLIIVVLAAIVIMTAGTVHATTTLSIHITDSRGNDITNRTVPQGTTVSVSAYYTDSSGNAVQAKLTEYYDNGLGPQLIATLYLGTVNSGGTITKPCTLVLVGTYTFRWNCTVASTNTQSDISPNCPPPQPHSYQQSCQVITSPQNKVPEPLPIAGLTIGLIAFGFFTLKSKRTKRQNLPLSSRQDIAS